MTAMEFIVLILMLPFFALSAACSIGLFRFVLDFFDSLNERAFSSLVSYEQIAAEVGSKSKPKSDFRDMDSLQALQRLRKQYDLSVWQEGIRHNLYNGYKIHKRDLFFDGKGGILIAVRATDEQVRNYWEGHQLYEGDLFIDDKDGEILIAVRASDEQLKGFKGLLRAENKGRKRR